MRLLLDTHVYLWWLAADARLGGEARRVIADHASIVHVSAATIWEAGIKLALGRLDAGGADLVQEIGANGFTELPVTARHAWAASQLPPHYRDPFDRVLVAQAQKEHLRLITADAVLAKYEVDALRV
ncbi:MAG: type II toxin-antitoxin system VapC family toxin [Egibacteraceae bacterium]